MSLKRVAWALLGLALVAAAVAAGITWQGRRALRAELQRIRATGAPLSADEIDCPDPGPGDDPLPWLAEVESLEERGWDDTEVADRLLEVVATIPGGEGRVEALGWSWSQLVSWLDAQLLDPRRAADVARDWQPALDLRAQRRALLLEHTEQVDDLARIDMRALLESDPSLGEVARRLPVSAVIELGRTLGDAALDAARRGELERTRELLLRALELSELLAWSPVLIGELARGLCVELASAATLRCAHQLPAGTDLRALEDALGAQAPREHLRFALEAERALVHDLCEQIRRGGDPFGGSGALRGVRGWSRRLGIDHDERSALRRLGVMIEALDSPWAQALPRLEQPPPSTPWRLVSRTVVPQGRGIVETGLRARARCELTLLALLARRAGTEETLSRLESGRDPFGAGPLRGRLEEDGVLVLWSVGPDGEDDGGATELPHDDVAVAVQPAG